MVKRLPTTAMLEVFDAVMTHGGFLKASKHLSLSAPAVSYSIRSLEKLLGLELFERRPDGITPNKNAIELVVDVRHVIERIRHLSAKAMKMTSEERSLRILTSQAFASLWLLPRMGDLIKTFPDWRFEVISWIGGHGTHPDNRTSGIDVEILWADQEYDARSLDSRVVAQDHAVAVCSPRYLAELGDGFSAATTQRATAINALNWPGVWARWLEHAFGSKERFRDEIHLQTTSLCVQAAQGGVGIALAHWPLIQRELADGSLVLASSVALPLQEDYIAFRYSQNANGIFHPFTDWLVHNMISGQRAGA